MVLEDPKASSRTTHAIWCGVAAAALGGATRLAPVAFPNSSEAGPWLVAVFAAVLVAAYASWRLVRLHAYPWLIPLAGISLLLLQPGRSGAPTWRLEWGVFGLGWTAVAVAGFLQAFFRGDELERRMQVEGAATALVLSVALAVVYALFESQLPVLDAAMVATTLLFTWWAGWLTAAIRYR